MSVEQEDTTQDDRSANMADRYSHELNYEALDLYVAQEALEKLKSWLRNHGVVPLEIPKMVREQNSHKASITFYTDKPFNENDRLDIILETLPRYREMNVKVRGKEE